MTGGGASETRPRKVLVTGAGGKTGRLVFEKLLHRPTDFTAVGVVRTAVSKETLTTAGMPAIQIIVADICDATAMDEVLCQGMDAVIVCTSATPAPTGETTPDGRPILGFPNGQPEQVDWQGQKNQIDAACKAGTVSHVVLCGSAGGTKSDHFLNTIGRAPDGTGGNILRWKRKAEKYLIESGLTYTIVHPGGLTDEQGGMRELVVGVDDKFDPSTTSRMIPRADVADVLIASLEYDSYKNRSFDVRSRELSEGTITTDFDKLLADLKENCDYSLGAIPE